MKWNFKAVCLNIEIIVIIGPLYVIFKVLQEVLYGKHI